MKKVDFVKLGEVSEVPSGKMKVFKVGEEEYLVANVNGNYYAIGNRCTHANADLSQGSLEGNIVICPKHKSRFDVTTGRAISGPKILFTHPKINDEPSYEAKVEGNAIFLKVDDANLH
jgi:nitrite reductase/ring-hydroxylating ferredoxin subunit